MGKINPSTQFRRASNMSWTPPLHGFVKLNMDASINVHSHRSAIGGLIQDHNSFCIGAFNTRIEFMSPLFVEIFAIKEGLEWTLSLSYNHIPIESNSSLTVQIVLQLYRWQGHKKDLILTSGNLLLHLPNVSLMHIFHEANKSAN